APPPPPPRPPPPAPERGVQSRLAAPRRVRARRPHRLGLSRERRRSRRALPPPAVRGEPLPRPAAPGGASPDGWSGGSRYPFPAIAQTVRGNRKIGLGVMGFADLLAALDVAYGEPGAASLGGDVMSRIPERGQPD